MVLSRICGLELAPGAGIWGSRGDRGKTFWAENGRIIGSLGTIHRGQCALERL